LLDDVLSELDEERAAAFLAGVGDFDQAFITATHVPAGLPASANVARVTRGRLEMRAVC
jgi:recombinational DNA repair ATPase RecF